MVSLSAEAHVEVEVLNVAGRVVRRICQDKVAPAGASIVLWDGRGDTGTRVPGGRYLVRLNAREDDGQQRQAMAAVAMGR